MPKMKNIFFAEKAQHENLFPGCLTIPSQPGWFFYPAKLIFFNPCMDQRSVYAIFPDQVTFF